MQRRTCSVSIVDKGASSTYQATKKGTERVGRGATGVMPMEPPRLHDRCMHCNLLKGLANRAWFRVLGLGFLFVTRTSGVYTYRMAHEPMESARAVYSSTVCAALRCVSMSAATQAPITTCVPASGLHGAGQRSVRRSPAGAGGGELCCWHAVALPSNDSRASKS